MAEPEPDSTAEPPRLRRCKTSGQTSEEVRNPQSPLNSLTPSPLSDKLTRRALAAASCALGLHLLCETSSETRLWNLKGAAPFSDKVQLSAAQIAALSPHTSATPFRLNWILKRPTRAPWHLLLQLRVKNKKKKEKKRQREGWKVTRSRRLPSYSHFAGSAIQAPRPVPPTGRQDAL